MIVGQHSRCTELALARSRAGMFAVVVAPAELAPCRMLHTESKSRDGLKEGSLRDAYRLVELLS